MADQKIRNEGRHHVEAQQALGKKIKEAKNQYLSDARYVSLQRDAEAFKKVLGDEAWDKSEAGANELTSKWRKDAESLLFNQKITEHTFNERIKFVRQFLGWAETLNKLDRIPRKKSLFFKFNVVSDAKAIPLPLLRKLWTTADNRDRCWIALGLNMGFYSKDLSNLTNEMIDGDYINFVRGKTGVKVRYKMWPVTKKLIEATRTSQTGPVWTSEADKPLNYYVAGSSMSRVDCVRNSFYRLCGVAGVPVDRKE